MITLLLNVKTRMLVCLCLGLLACEGASNNTNINRPPVITSATNISIPENSIDVTTIIASDADGDALSYSLSGGIDQSLFSLSAVGVLSFNTAPNYESPIDSDTNNTYQVQVTVSDGKRSVQQAITVNVTNINEFSPIFTAATTASVNENVSYVTTLFATDADGDNLTYSLSGGADVALFTINSASGVIAFISAPDFEAPADSDQNNSCILQVSVSDGDFTSTQALTVNVIDVVNEFAPLFTSPSAFTVAENTTAVGTVTATDPDGGVVSFSITGGADQALFNINSSNGVLIFNSAPDFETPEDSDSNNVYIVQITANDGTDTTNQIVSVTINNQNDNSPVITTTGSFTVAENSTAVGVVTATDADGNAITYTISGGADQSLFSINNISGALVFNVSPDYEMPIDSGGDNIYVVQVRASDGLNAASQTINVAVTNMNDVSPIFTTANTFTVAENTTAIATVAATDAEGDVVTYALTGGVDQSRFNINSASGALAFISAPDFETPTDNDSNNVYVVQITASDATNTTNQTISVTVTNVNDVVPVFTTANTFTVAENSTAVATLMAVDELDAVLSYSLSGGVDQALFNINSTSGALTFGSAPNFEAPADGDANNSYIIQVSVSDGIHTATQTITVTVTNLNDIAPVINSPANVFIAENATSVLTVAAADAEGDSITYSITGGADQAAFNINSTSGVLVFNNAPDFESPTDSDGNNSYLVQVSANDGANTTNQTITVNVTDVSETAYGLTSRPSNATCSIPNPPPTSSTITLTRVFPSLTFNLPVALRQSPTNLNRWYVLEQNGVIRTFLTGDSSSTVFADLRDRVLMPSGEMGLLGMAFHPDFASNGFVYLYYSGGDGGAATHHASWISRFTITSESLLNIDSELLILQVGQPYDNHNGGNILFGPDGYLYIGLGDGGSGGDPNNNAQNIDSLLGKMLRINVDVPANGNQYSSPADNPYVGIAGLDEIYALGLRNPWRWSFDRITNNLIAGDVGQGTWEEIDIIVNGGNYGWRCYEGNADYNTSGCSARSNYIFPIHAYDHNAGISVTGGYVYRGSITSLYGKYIFSDYGTGPIWIMDDPYGTPSVSELISNTTTNAMYVSSFTEDADGELYVVSYLDGRIYRIETDAGIPSGTFPTLLSETGCVNPLDPTQMAEGVIPYEINAPFWSDGADKGRWFAIPDGTTITIDQNDDWVFPNNSVTIKDFRLNNKLVETRLLVKHNDGSWAGYSYEWNDTETDASLVLNGKTKDINGQTYIYPSSAQCMFCHTQVSGYALGPETRQLNRDKTYASTGITANQISTLDHIGMFSSSPGDPAALPKLTAPTNTAATLQDRARAYLYTNCAQCHRQGGPSNVALDFNITTVNADMNVCNAVPSYNIGGANYVLSPGDANDSTLYHRMNCRTGNIGCFADDQMPPIGSTVVDSAGATLLSNWINSLGSCQ